MGSFSLATKSDDAMPPPTPKSDSAPRRFLLILLCIPVLLILLLVYCLLPAVIVSGIVYCRGTWRAFFIGTAPWTAASFFFVALSWFGSQQFQWFPNFWPYNAGDDEIFFVKAILAVPLVIAGVSGFIGMGIRSWALSMNRTDHSQNPTTENP